MPLKAFVVEDHASIRQSLVEALAELAGIETAGTAATESEAVAWLTDPTHAWDLAIVDLLLEPAGGTGYGVLRAVRNRAPGRKVVVLTGSADPQVRRECESLGSDGVFDKAMDTEALLAWCQDLASARPG